MSKSDVIHLSNNCSKLAESVAKLKMAKFRLKIGEMNSEASRAQVITGWQLNVGCILKCI